MKKLFKKRKKPIYGEDSEDSEEFKRYKRQCYKNLIIQSILTFILGYGIAIIFRLLIMLSGGA